MNEKLKQILFNYKKAPPPETWNHIRRQLQEKAVRHKLFHYAAPPSHSVWEKLNNELNQAWSAPSKPRRRSLLWIPVAALLLLAFVFDFFLNRKKPAPTPAARTEQIYPPASNLQNKAPQDRIFVKKAAKNNSGGKQNFEFVIRQRPSGNEHPFQRTVLKGQLSEAVVALVAPHEKIRILDLGQPDEYLVYTQDNLHYTRVAKKVFPLVLCATVDHSCKNQIDQLQSRVTTASFTAGFTGFVDMLIHLRENQ